MNPLNETLRLIRAFHALNQKETAERLGLGQSYLSEIENGRKKLTLDVLDAYARVFKMRPWEIVLISENLEAPLAPNWTGDWSKVLKKQIPHPKINKMLEWLDATKDVRNA